MLGAFLALGGLNGALAQDAGANSILLGALPRLPENWSDLPFQFHLSETTGYNSNVLGSPRTTVIFNNTPIKLQPIGAFEVDLFLRSLDEIQLGQPAVFC